MIHPQLFKQQQRARMGKTCEKYADELRELLARFEADTCIVDADRENFDSGDGKGHFYAVEALRQACECAYELAHLLTGRDYAERVESIQPPPKEPQGSGEAECF